MIKPTVLFFATCLAGLLTLVLSSAVAVPLELPSGKKFCAEVPGTECIGKEDSGAEIGQIDDMRYKLYGDGSGVAEGMQQAGIENYIDNNMWHLECNRDSINGRKTCLAHFRDLWLQANGQSQVLVSVGTDHYPGSLSSLRIGKARFDTTQKDGYFSAAQSAQIVSLLSKKASTATRFMKWPYRSWVVEEFDPFGVNGIVKILKWVARTGK